MAGHQELSPSEVKELLEAFSLFDKDNDGVISSGELRAVLAALGYSENDKDAGDILKKADLNGDGVLTFPEYERLIRDHVMPLQVMEKQARDIFRTFDKGKKGFMDDQDFRRFLIAHGQKSTEEAMYGRFESLDKMGSGRLSVKDVTPTIRQILFES